MAAPSYGGPSALLYGDGQKAFSSRPSGGFASAPTKPPRALVDLKEHGGRVAKAMRGCRVWGRGVPYPQMKMKGFVIFIANNYLWPGQKLGPPGPEYAVNCTGH